MIPNINLRRRRSIFFYAVLLFLGLVGGLWQGAMIVVINSTVSQTSLPFVTDSQNVKGLIFLILGVVSFLAQRHLQISLMKLTNEITCDLELDFLAKIRNSSFLDFKKLGTERIYTALQDIKTVTGYPDFLLSFFNASVTCIICFGYLADQSPIGVLALLVAIIILTLIYVSRMQTIKKYYSQLRVLEDRYFRNLKDFIGGHREIKMSASRTSNIFEKVLMTNRREVWDVDLRSGILSFDSNMIAAYSWFFLIGFIIFVLPSFAVIPSQSVITFIIGVLFLRGPLGSIIGLFPEYSRMRIAARRLNAIDDELSAFLVSNRKIDVDNLKKIEELKEQKLRNINLVDVSFKYDEESKPTLMDVNFTLQKGEVVFLVGDNGSGKTTLMYILAGLIAPQNGKLYFNEHAVTDKLLSTYRDKITFIFSDQYLFESNYEDYDLRADNKVLTDYIAEFRLAHAVKFDPGNEVIADQLSAGQKKRLALVYALMENKEIMILDEWASEQDHFFRKQFYEVFLAEFKRMGKSIVLATHDMDYLHCADRIIKIDSGRLVEYRNHHLHQTSDQP